MILKKSNMKHFTAIVLLLSMIFSFHVPFTMTKVKAENYEPVSVNIVEDITLNNNAANVVTKNLDFSAKTNNFTESYYYQFTLDSLSYIHIREYADIWDIHSGGTIEYYISSSPTFTEQWVISKDGNGTEGNYFNLYEAGTYYVKVEISYTSQIRFLKASPYYNFSVSVQPIARTGMTNGASQSTAIALPKSSYTTGVISQQNTKQYFSFTQKSEGVFSTDIVSTAPSGWTLPDLTVSLCNEAGGVITNTTLHSSNMGTLSVKNLAKGIYYILVTSKDGSSNQRGVCLVTANASYQTMAKLAAPKLKTYKAGTKKITGTAVKGAKVTVKVGKKSYTATAKNGKFTIKTKSALKKGNTIKVKATKSGYQASKTVSYKVKKR